MSDASAKKVSKAKKQVKLAEHPKYSDMIKAAILALKERTGSSRQAIVKYIKENYKVGDNAGVHVRTALKKMLTAKLLVQTKGTGASGSYKLSEVAKKAPKPKEKVLSKKKPAAKEPKKKPATKDPKKKPAAKKPAAKKASKPTKTKTKELSTTKPAVKKPATKKSVAKKPTKKPVAKKAAKKTANKWAAFHNKPNGSSRSHQNRKRNDQ